MPNVHSHAFQRTIAGRTERRGTGRDSFWTWRDQMYRLLGTLGADQIGAIAGLAFMEMLEAGFAAVGEFHYVHNGPDGTPYEDPATLSGEVMEAARRTGIGLTLLPVRYGQGGLDGRPLSGDQRRFGTTPDSYGDLIDRCRRFAETMPGDTIIGVAPHSLRAVPAAELSLLCTLADGRPFHIHVAEQVAEVDEVRAHLGGRPVEWLLSNVPVDRAWCLIHATHMTVGETRGLAETGAVAGLCPVTEANLGDGIFPGRAWHAAGGAFAIGTDSNVAIALPDELRMLEYAQRLSHRERTVMAESGASVGETLYTNAATGGAQALGRNAGVIEEGRLADLVAIDPDDPALWGLPTDRFLDGFVFSTTRPVVTDVLSAGRHVVKAGRHVARDHIMTAYRRAMRDAFDAL